ncbi:MAG TPA: S8 family serine peptidase [Pseudolabrys sp.]|nr:S8 family serine peptidase [Pseudolabrys sp.]
MRLHRTGLLVIAAATLLIAGGGADAQKMFNRGGSQSIGVSRGNDGGYQGSGHRNGWRGPGVFIATPQYVSPGVVYLDDDPPPRPPRRSTRPVSSGAPTSNNQPMVPNEVVIEFANSVSQQRIDALLRRHRLTRIESQAFQLSGTTLYRWRIPDRRSVASVVRALEADRIVAQPNHLFALQADEPKPEGDAAQYELAKLHLPQAHSLAKGDGVRVAVIDSGIDAMHPEIVGAVTESYDTLSAPMAPHKHGTAIAGLIAAHGKLMGVAPAAHILAIRAFDGSGASAQGTTFNILKALDWAAAHGAQVINMSFAGPPDPALHRSIVAAHKKGIVLVAAAGNAGPQSPPLYPAADQDVIAVTATDAEDKLFAQSNRGRHIAVAAPGAQILVAIPDGRYEVSSGTSYSAAEISGIVALMLERRPDLSPDNVRDLLLATAKDLGPKGRDIMFGAGLADAYGALMAEAAPLTAAAPRPIERVSAGAR